jgi:hypothetical protein
MTDLFVFVVEIIQNKKHSREELENFIKSNDPKFKDLDDTFDFVLRSKRMTSDKEKAYCFVILYNAIRAKSQVPTFSDPKTGCVPKKINSIQEFIDYNKNSIFGFIDELDLLVNS